MSINGFYLMPHPPIIIPEIGKGEEEKIHNTIISLNKIGEEIKAKAPSTIIVVTPHGTMFRDAIALAYEDKISGNLEKFRAPRISMDFQINRALTSKIYEKAVENDISVVMASDNLLNRYNAEVALDHGTIVPLYFINKYYKNYKLVHITYAPLNDLELYEFGMIINEVVEESDEKVVFVASGDLSHRLKNGGPYDYSPFGEKFDREFIQQLQDGDTLSIFDMDNETVFKAGECGRKSVVIMLGALDNKKFNGELLSYEGPFGVGYGVIKFNIHGEGESKLLELKNIRKRNFDKKLNSIDPYVKLARQSLTEYLTTGEKLKKIPDYITEEIKNNKRGVFVSLKKHGELRGCIGTIFPVTNSIAEEIIRNAIEAGINDPRFNEVEKEELFDIDFSVDVLTEPEEASKKELDPKEYGVIVSCGRRKGLLLPDLEGVDSVEEQLSIALRKAGIGINEDYDIQKFRVIRHKE